MHAIERRACDYAIKYGPGSCPDGFLIVATGPLVVRRHYGAMAITDECSVSGVVRVHLEARERGIHFIVGSEILFVTASDTPFAQAMWLRTWFGDRGWIAGIGISQVVSSVLAFWESAKASPTRA